MRSAFDNKSSPPNIVSIISFLFLSSPPFSISLCSFRRSQDINVVDLYSDRAISLALTGNVGELQGYIGIGKCTFGDKCRYRHEIEPDYIKKEEVVVGKNNKDKR